MDDKLDKFWRWAKKFMTIRDSHIKIFINLYGNLNLHKMKVLFSEKHQNKIELFYILQVEKQCIKNFHKNNYSDVNIYSYSSGYGAGIGYGYDDGNGDGYNCIYGNGSGYGENDCNPSYFYNKNSNFTNQSEFVPGCSNSNFIYLKTKTYSCGGVTNTVKEFQHDKTEMKFVLIPAGSFVMGSNNGNDDEKPMRKINIKKPFLISKYPITQVVWKKIMENNPSGFRGDNRPVEHVSWDDAAKFCKQTGLKLPTEIQWEYACRGGTQTKYYWGNNMDEDYVWWHFNSNNKTHNVGQKKPNAFGLYDMLGNVWEWCLDYNRTPNGIFVTNPCSLHSYRAMRGGCWLNSTLSDLRSANRYDNKRITRKNYLGFRPCAILNEI